MEYCISCVVSEPLLCLGDTEGVACRFILTTASDLSFTFFFNPLTTCHLNK